jgi:UDP-N-acetylglucosamine/UDP-N-acetylgalactosamine 4-epimerase
MHTWIQNSTVLITGGAGFIGSNLCENLLSHDNRVICLDNFSTGKRENIAPFLTHPDFKLMEGDIRNFDDCVEAVTGVELVLHQAALGSVPRSLNDPKTTNDVNISGFLNMILAARNAGVKRFVYAASSSTYGDSTVLPKVEDQIGMPLSPYAVTKYVNELYAHVFGINYGLECIGLRYFNVFGRRQSPDGAYAAVVPKFIHLLLNGQSPTINGSGENSRDFTYIENVIQMNHLAATTTNLKAIGEVFNTAVGERATLLQLTKLLQKHLSAHRSDIAKIPIIHGPERQGDIPHSLASIHKATELLGYSPTHQLEAGLRETIDYILTQESEQ